MPDLIVLKVRLAYDRDIWRRIAIRGDQTLDHLHEAIYGAFDRDDEHMYTFYFPIGLKKNKNPRMGSKWLRDVPNYSCDGDDDGFQIGDPHLNRLKLMPKQVLYYLFDYGDEWWHEIEVESTGGKLESGKYPRVVEKQGKSPPQYENEDDEDSDEE